MTCGVYEIVNKETNQSYIGRSINIETRWKGHLSAPSGNMLPTIELYERNPSMVELNIIMEINESDFDKQELKFITSVCELYEINQRGGWESKNLINGRDGDILACPPSILSKRELLPECIDVEDLLYGIEKWANDVYRYRTMYPPSQNYKGEYDKDEFLYWVKEYHDLKEKNNVLTSNIESLMKTIEKYKPIGFSEESQEHSLEYRNKMSVDYEYFKLKKENMILKDENDELKSKISFWKEKAHHWRNEYFSKLESKLKPKQEKTLKERITDLTDLLTIDDLLNK